jgi:hypothetical protein
VSLILAGLVFAGTSGALYVGRLVAKRRAAAAAGVDPPNKNTDKDKAKSKGDKGDRDAKEKEGEEKEDDFDKRATAEVEAEIPTPKDSNPDAANADTGKKLSRKDAKADAKARDAKEKEKKRILQGEKAQLDGFVCQLGDVLMRITGEEAWLAGGLVLSEEMPVAVLFVAPDAGHDCAIYVRARPRDSLMWLEPLDPNAILVGGEPPSSVEHGGIRFDRARRLPLRPRRIGVGAPDVGDAVVVAEYASAGAERLLVLKANSGTVCAYRGLELEEGSFEVISSGESTLEQ